MLSKYFDSLWQILFNHGSFIWTYELIIILTILFISIFSYYLMKFISKHYISNLLLHSKSIFLQVLANKDGIEILGHLLAAVILKLGSNFIQLHQGLFPVILALFLSKISLLYLIIVLTIIITNIIKTLNPYYEKKFHSSKRYPIEQYINVVIFFIWLISILAICAFMVNISLTSIFTTIGALSAIILLIFKDTLLGIVSSIQATTANIVRVGDRICIDKYNLDGIVTYISINHVKLKNMDNTISTIPTYMLTSEIIKNWRLVEEVQERRIKRIINIDSTSIKILPASKVSLLQSKFNTGNTLSIDENYEYSNLSLFRIFIEQYLNSHIHISKTNTILVHYQDIGAYGIALGLYAFSNKINFDEYEKLIAEILEFCINNLSTFDLKLYQAV